MRNGKVDETMVFVNSWAASSLASAIRAKAAISARAAGSSVSASIAPPGPVDREIRPQRLFADFQEALAVHHG